MDLDAHDIRMRGMDDEDDDDEQDDLDRALEGAKRRHMDDDDEEEDEEDEEEERNEKARKAKRRRREMAANPYIDVQAEVSEDDGDDDEEDEEAEAGFVQYQQNEDEDEEDGDPERGAAHARLYRQRLNESEMSSEELAKRLRERYARTDQRVEELASVPQRMLMPSVNDPNLWQIKVKPGRERDIVLSLFRKKLDFEYKGKPLQIISAFERSSIQGYIYVEARSKEAVITACANLVGIYRRDPILIPINEMAPLLQLKRREIDLQPGAWVRLKRGKYQGDLAQVVDITDNGEEAGIRFLPRIDMNPRETELIDGKLKRKRGGNTTSTGVGRPPARPFNPEEVLRIWGKKNAVRRGPSWIFQGETFTNGFLEKDIRVSALVIENVVPTLDEVAVFLGNDKDKNGIGGGSKEGTAANLAALAEAIRRPVTMSFQPGDHVEVFQGEQVGARGVVDSVIGDVVLIRGEGLELDGRLMEVPSKHMRKVFSPGDHVKVMAGVNTDETGMVVSVNGDLVTFLSDLTETEITVFSKDLRTAAEVGSSSNVVGNYELHDLVQLDTQTVGVIYRIERESFRVLDQNGQTRLVQPHQITMRRDSKRAISTDAEGNELRVGDNVKEIDGETRRGVVLHIHQAFFAFLHNREVPQNGGIFVTRCRSLAPIAPKGTPKQPGIDLSKMNPAISGATGGAPSMSKGPRDRLIGVIIKIIKGTQKGYAGVIKDVNGQYCRVELSTNNRIITIEKEKLRRVGQGGQLEPLEGGGGFAHPGQARGGGSSFGGSSSSVTAGRTPNPYNSDGGRTPGWGATGRTPNPYADRRTPAWSAAANTPNPYLNSSKTPSWNADSRTPNPYTSGGDGSRTPGWNASSRTPNPYTSTTSGSKTPSWDSGSRTPNPVGKGNSRMDDNWGTQSSDDTRSNGASTGFGSDRKSGRGPNSSNNSDPWADVATTPVASAPTPYTSAATPYISAATPYTSAPTPAISAATPYISAPTPASYASETPAAFSAPTPGGYMTAPTPGAVYAAPTPAASAGFAAPTPRGVAAAASERTMDSFSSAPRRSFGRTKDDPKWLLNFKIRGIHAQVRDTSDFFGGQLNNREVVVFNVSEVKAGLVHMAMVAVMGDDSARYDIPITELQPVHPVTDIYKNRNAVLLDDQVGGVMRQERVILRTLLDQEWLCERTTAKSAAGIEVTVDSLCLVD
ncbi:transcription elongation factor spt5 [Serendipita sp. 400]|nr:transcription elongation factor spt5 [Serendipita sp. 400]